jgi:bifunctional DNA-binding transcriptional regulator/antitoxin component of YhaV-PrlF toxin-antitoxin module
MKYAHVVVSKSGRIVLPAEFLAALGVGRGGNVVLALQGRTIRVRSLDDVITQVQRRTRRLLKGKGASVDDFLAERRREAAREEAEWAEHDKLR